MNDHSADVMFTASMDSELNANEITDDLGLGVVLEALLFVADHPLTISDMSEITGAPEPDVAQVIETLQETYGNRGIVLLEHTNGYRMVSSPKAALYCRRLLGIETRTRLSRAALETLGIIAYRQPVTRTQIEDVRGVDGDSALATLLSRGLIEETGRLDTPGRPVMFGTSDIFLAYFGITSLADLPDLDLPKPDPPVEIPTESATDHPT